jgi:tRNA(fMet)-specific endonuclease VapC
MSGGPVLLDTGILVHLMRNDALAKKAAEDHSLSTRVDKPLICVVSVGEALAFARKRSWGAPRVEKLVELLRQLVVVDINSAEVLEAYASVDAWCHSNGKVLGKNDLWIAATSSVTGAHLLTTDRDFDALEGLFVNRTCYAPDAPHA